MPNWNTIREPRMGICLHYDDSASDAGAVEWLTKDPRCHVSYNWLVLDGGALVVVAPSDARAWHAGICKPSDARIPYRDANSALYGIAIAAKGTDVATEAQKQAVATLCRALYSHHGWDTASEVWRIVGHDSEAWPRGRKIDPTGPNRERPVLSVMGIRGRVASGNPVLASG